MQWKNFRALDELGPRWYGLQFNIGEQALASAEIKQLGLECWCPIMRRVMIRRGAKVPYDTPLFGRYMFVLFDVGNDQRWRRLRTRRGVTALIPMQDELPVPAFRGAVEELRERSDAGEFSEEERDRPQLIQVQYVEGDIVRLNAGPFTSFNAMVEMHEADRMKVFVEIFGRRAPIEINPRDVELVAPSNVLEKSRRMKTANASLSAR